MENIQKENIVNTLRRYCERYESQNRASASLNGVSSATISQMLNGNWGLIKDEMWRNVASQIGYKDAKWVAVETANFRTITDILSDAQGNSLVMAITDHAGAGKTFSLKHYTESHKHVYMLCCDDHWDRKIFLNELLMSLGRECVGQTVGEMMKEVIRTLKVCENPLLILDEADKLKDFVLTLFISLYNKLEDECGIVLCATSHLEKRLRQGLKSNARGYAEIWSRIGSKCIALRGVSAADITLICEKNGITDKKSIDLVLGDCEGNLRRVRRKIHAIIKQQSKTV